MIRTIVFNHPYAYEAERLIRAFFPPFTAELKSNAPEPDDDFIYTAIEKDAFTVKIKSQQRIITRTKTAFADSDSERERLLSVLIFNALCEFTGQRPGWGILTGIRPVKLLGDKAAILGGKTDEYFTESLLVLPEKLKIANRILEIQEPIEQAIPNDGFSLYIGIPFCPSRCSYCSFVSHSIDKAGRLIPGYVDNLCREIAILRSIAERSGIRLDTVYFGGGTPTVLSAEQLKRLFDEVSKFDRSALREFTVEAGRPDTITAEKLNAIKAAGAERISINPQTMNDRVLDAVGRKHTAADIERAYFLAREIGFDCINMDLIAGLPTDDYDGFCESLERVAELSPENITVHTLSLKRSSALYHDAERGIGGDIGKMVDFAYERLTGRGYNPYYLYRQKNTIENQENIGYSKPGFESLYNIYIMEEKETILAAGCGGSTKIVKNGKINRVCNFKYPYEYIGRFDEMNERKKEIEKLLSE